MKNLLLAAAATLALSLPAMAQSGDTNMSGQTQGQQGQTGSQTQTIDPSSLSKAQIRQIQTSLNKAGFNAKKADGVWGRETSAALRNFQKQKNISGAGELNQQTLAALGVNFGAPSQTTGAPSNEDMNKTPGTSNGSMSSPSGSQMDAPSPNMNPNSDR
jgi:peptidoglycan hydrolase-like protein with peptidoglycan-binding domain